MVMKFLKKLGKNFLFLFATGGILYSFMTVAERWLGDSFYGLLAFLIFILTYWVTERSWHEAKQELER